MMIVTVAAIDRTEDGQPVENAGLQRQVLAEADARNFRGDRGEGPADFDGRLGLGIPRIEMTGTAGQPEENDGPPSRPILRSGLGSTTQHVGQRQAGDACQAGLQEPPSGADVNQIGPGRLQQSPLPGNEVLDHVSATHKFFGHDCSSARTTCASCPRPAVTATRMRSR